MSNKFRCEKSEDCTIVFTSKTRIYVSSDDFLGIEDVKGDNTELRINIYDNVTFDILSSSPIDYDFKGEKGKIKVRAQVRFNPKQNVHMINVEAEPSKVKTIAKQSTYKTILKKVERLDEIHEQSSTDEVNLDENTELSRKIKEKEKHTVPILAKEKPLASAAPSSYAAAAKKLSKPKAVQSKPSPKNSCTAIHRPLNRVGVSCYYDSLFFALFALATPFVTKNLFNAKNQENEELCRYLYTIYQKFTTGAHSEICAKPPIYLLPDRLDRMGHDAEVLFQIFTRLNINPVVYRHDVTYKMDQVPVHGYNMIENKPPLIQLLYHTTQTWSQDENNFILKTDYKFNKEESKKNLIKTTDANGAEKQIAYDKTENIEKYNIKDLTFLVIENAGLSKMVKKRAVITYNENDKIQNIDKLVCDVNSSLKLNKLTCKSGGAEAGHYICYFRCNENWYEYDDTRGIAGPIPLWYKFPTIRDGFYWSLLFFDDTAPSI